MKFWNVHHSNKIQDVRLTPQISTVGPNSKFRPKLDKNSWNWIIIFMHSTVWQIWNICKQMYAINAVVYLQMIFFWKNSWNHRILGGFKPFWNVNSCAVLGRQQGICIQVQTCSRVGGSSSSWWRRRMCRSSLVIVVNQATTHQIPE